MIAVCKVPGCVCDILKKCFLSNSILNSSILLELSLCLVSAALILFQMKRWYTRFTNVILLLSSIQNAIALCAWYVSIKVQINLSEECNTLKIDLGILFLALISLVEGMCFLFNRQFALKLQDASFMDKLLRNTDSELEAEGSSET